MHVWKVVSYKGPRPFFLVRWWGLDTRLRNLYIVAVRRALISSVTQHFSLYGFAVVCVMLNYIKISA